MMPSENAVNASSAFWISSEDIRLFNAALQLPMNASGICLHFPKLAALHYR